MTLLEFLKLLAQHLRLMLVVAVLLSGTVFILTMNGKKNYTSKTVINTGLVSSYNIENHDSDSKVDREYANNELMNLITLATAHETMEELSAKLIAQYLMIKKPDPQWVTSENFKEIQEVLPTSVRDILVDSTLEQTYHNVLQYSKNGLGNPVDNLIHSDQEYFGVDYLKKQLKADRKIASDLLEFTYTTTDPAICQRTLLIMSEIFIAKQRDLKENQSTSVLDFFKRATDETAAQLRAAEEKLLNFQVENKIINYYEQTRFIADRKEDLDEQFFKENMEMQAMQSALTSIEGQLNGKIKISQLNDDLLEKRKELTLVAEMLAKYELLGTDQSTINPTKLLALRTRFDELQHAIKDYAQKAYNINQTPEGVATRDLLQKWLDQMVMMEKAKARIHAYGQRQEEFGQIYSQFAPWGSSLKKIEREIALAEDAYLENLHSYNQARLHLQNTLMSANLRLLDAPYYPTEAVGSKRMMLVIVAFLAGFMLVFALVIALEFLDNTLKNPTEAAKIIGVRMLGILPKFPSSEKQNRQRVDYEFIRRRSVEQLVQHVNLETMPVQKTPKQVLIGSTREQEGKTFVTNLIVNHLRTAMNRVLYIHPFSDTQPAHRDNAFYLPDSQFPRKTDWQSLLADGVNWDDFDYIFLEIPGLLAGQYPIQLVNQADLVVLTTRSNRSWNAADKKALDALKKCIKSPIRLIINGVQESALEASLGEIPKQRSPLRRWIKRLASLNFSAKSKI